MAQFPLKNENVDIFQFGMMLLQGGLIGALHGFPGTGGPFFLIHREGLLFFVDFSERTLAFSVPTCIFSA